MQSFIVSKVFCFVTVLATVKSLLQFYHPHYLTAKLSQQRVQIKEPHSWHSFGLNTGFRHFVHLKWSLSSLTH